MVSKHRLKVRAPTREPDPDEEAALDRAVVAYRGLRASDDPCAVVSAVISEWIVERARRTVSYRLPADLMFDLGDVGMRGAIEAALPKIGAELQHLPDDVPLFALTRSDIVDVFVAGLAWIGEAEVALAVSEVTPSRERAKLDDEIPF